MLLEFQFIICSGSIWVRALVSMSLTDYFRHERSEDRNYSRFQRFIWYFLCWAWSLALHLGPRDLWRVCSARSSGSCLPSCCFLFFLLILFVYRMFWMRFCKGRVLSLAFATACWFPWSSFFFACIWRVVSRAKGAIIVECTVFLCMAELLAAVPLSNCWWLPYVLSYDVDPLNASDLKHLLVLKHVFCCCHEQIICCLFVPT